MSETVKYQIEIQTMKDLLSFLDKVATGRAVINTALDDKEPEICRKITGEWQKKASALISMLPNVMSV